MFWTVAKFEFLYHAKRPIFWVLFLLLFGMGLDMTSTNLLGIAGGGTRNLNSPSFLYAAHLFISIMMGVAPVIAFLVPSLLRDIDEGFTGILFSTPLTKRDYLLGRFSGATTAVLMVLSAITIGSALGIFTPWGDPERIGAFLPEAHLVAFFVAVVPGTILYCSVILMVSALTRSTTLTFSIALVYFVFLMAPFALGGALGGDLGAIFEPSGSTVLLDTVRYWTVTDRNSLMVPIEGPLLYNRLIIIAIGLLILGLTSWRFDMRLHSIGHRLPWSRRKAGDRKPYKRIEKPSVKPRIFNFGTQWVQLAARTRFELVAAVKTAPFIILMLLGMLVTLVNLVLIKGLFGLETIPVTRFAIGIISGRYAFLVLIALVFHAAETVWRDRRMNAHELLDSAPVSNGTFVLSKLAGVALIIPAMFMVSILTSVFYQAISGYTDFELGWYAQRLLFVESMNLFTWAILLVFIQVLTNNKYLGLALTGSFVFVNFFLFNIQFFDHNLLNYGGRPIAPLSDMGGNGHFLEGQLWFQFYWLLFASMLAIVTFLLWGRGTPTSIRDRIRRIRAVLTPALARTMAILFVAFAGTGGWIFYNTNVLNEFMSAEDVILDQLDFEGKFRQYDGMPMPRITDVRVEIDIFPRERRYRVRGTYELENKTSEPISEVHAVHGRLATVLAQSLKGAAVAWSDEVHNYTAFALEKPMAPGDRLTFTFETELTNPGFRNTVSGLSLAYNGTHITGRAATPWIGFTGYRMLGSTTEREKRGLDPISLPHPQTEGVERQVGLWNDSDYIGFEAIVSTSVDQIAVAPGKLEREWTENGRRYFHYKVEEPNIPRAYMFASADYEIARDKWNEVDLEIYYHAPHTFNIERMMTTMKKSMDYFSANFSPYPSRRLRLLERPVYRSLGASAFPEMILFSEGTGFVGKVGENQFDLVSAITAHEVAHSWWGLKVSRAGAEGNGVLSETLAQYSMAMVMEREYGAHLMRTFLIFQLDRYLRGRSSDPSDERPLYLSLRQNHLLYGKGLLAMYALKDYMGEQAVNRALRSLIRNHAFNPDRYPTSLDLIRYLRAEAQTDDNQQLITDLFEKIILWDLRVSEPTVELRADGRFDVAIPIVATKMDVTGDGIETEIPLDMRIDVGAFSNHPENARPGDNFELYLEKRPIVSGENVINLILDERPSHVGVDPYTKLLDRRSDDNIVPVADRPE